MKKWNVVIRDRNNFLVAEMVVFAPSHRGAKSMGIWWAVEHFPRHWTEYRAEASVLKFGRRGV